MATTSTYPLAPSSTSSSRLSTDSYRTSSSSTTNTSNSSIPLSTTYAPSSHSHTHQQPRYSQSHASRRSQDGILDHGSVDHGNTHTHDDEGKERYQELGEVGDVAPPELAQPVDLETRLRKRDYAVEISRIMGRQLVAAMRGGRSGSGSASGGASGGRNGIA